VAGGLARRTDACSPSIFLKQSVGLPGKNHQQDVNLKLDLMKSTTMDLTWEQNRLTQVAVCGVSRRPSVQDSLWVSLMSASRSLDSALEDRLMGFPRRPAARRASQAGARPQPVCSASASAGRATWAAEDVAFALLGASGLAALVTSYWQVLLPAG
jgi:hypothetical protein